MILPLLADQAVQPDLLQTLLPFPLVGFIFVLGSLPSLLAFDREHPRRWAILWINAAFGFTIIGWVTILVWALKKLPTENPDPTVVQKHPV